MNNKYTLIVLFCFCFLLQFSHAQNKVLVLHSYHVGYHWTDNLHRGIAETLETNDEIEVYVEFMDLIRNQGDDYLQLLEDTYRQKYTSQGIDFDAIIVADDGAFNFLLDKRVSLFNNAPVVFTGVDDFHPGRIDDQDGITGVNVEASIEETIEIASRLLDDKGRIAVISGSRLTEEIFLEHFQDTEPLFADKYEFLYLTNLEPGELETQLNELNENDIIFYLSYLLTPSGKRLTVEESLDLITRSTDVPVLTIREFTLLYGAFGGKVVHGFSHGEAAAHKALRIVDGENAGDIPVLMESPNMYMFNGEMLHRYEISEKLLPRNSMVVNRVHRSLIEGWDSFVEGSLFAYDLFENHGSVMFIIQPGTGIIIDANKAACDYYGYDELVGKTIYDINTLTAGKISYKTDSARRHNRHEFQFEHILADNSIRDVEVYTYPLSVNGYDVMFSIVFDITEKLEAERQLLSRNKWIIRGSVISLTIFSMLIVLLIIYLKITRDKKKEVQESEEKFRSYVDNAPVAIFVTDKQGRYLQANYLACVISGLPEDKLLSTSMDKILPPDILKQVEPINREILKEGKISREFTVEHQTGAINHVTIDTVKLSENRYMTFVSDITERKQMEQELKQTNANLEEMVYIASHDLQVPLISMESYATELLENYKDKLDEEGKYCLSRLKSNSQRMHKLIISLLDISRLNTVKMNYEVFNLKIVVKKIARDISLTIEKANVDILIRDLPNVYADKQRIENVLRNLIINAISFGGKNIEIFFDDNVLVIRDDGIGIPPGQLERIFRPGERIKAVKCDGIGMGLTFCKKVVEQHNGKIWAESEGNNKGTSFFIKFKAENILKTTV